MKIKWNIKERYDEDLNLCENMSVEKLRGELERLGKLNLLAIPCGGYLDIFNQLVQYSNRN